jgi:hypothetical protein
VTTYVVAAEALVSGFFDTHGLELRGEVIVTGQHREPSGQDAMMMSAIVEPAIASR